MSDRATLSWTTISLPTTGKMRSSVRRPKSVASALTVPSRPRAESARTDRFRLSLLSGASFRFGATSTPSPKVSMGSGSRVVRSKEAFAHSHGRKANRAAPP